jgi:tetratricopeptide (TPR) repeat protein
MALRERANALLYLTEFKSALAALDEAAPHFDDGSGAMEFDLATLDHIRARVYLALGRFAEAQLLARRAATVFAAYSDTDRETAARIAEAVALTFLGQADAALKTYQDIARVARFTGDLPLLARALQNCGGVQLELGEYPAAAASFAEALDIFDAVGLQTEKLRAMWSVGTVRAREGALEEAAQQLDATRRLFAGHGLTNDAALVTLEWAEVQLALDRPSGVAEACRSCVLAFNAEGMDRKAREALAHLNDALQRGRATPDLVRHIRTYIENLPSHPEEPFRLPN